MVPRLLPAATNCSSGVSAKHRSGAFPPAIVDGTSRCTNPRSEGLLTATAPLSPAVNKASPPPDSTNALNRSHASADASGLSPARG